MERRAPAQRFVTRPVYLRSQLRNNTNTVSTLVLLIHLLDFSVHGTQVSHITGRSRPPGEVGLTPRQYMEWNVAGRARSTGDPSQQGLLPEVYRTASTGRCAHLHDRVLNKPTNYQQRTDPRSCVRVVYIAGDTLRHQPMGAGHMMVLQLRGPMAFRVLQWCHPMLASTKRTSCCTRMITLYGARKWIQAPTHPPPSGCRPQV